MIYLMKRNSSYIIQLAILVPFLTVAWFIKTRPLDSFQIFMGAMWMVLAIMGGTINGEMMESKNKGYAFLQILPVKNRDIVLSKFLMAGLAACVLVLHINILFLFLQGPPHLFSLGRLLIPFFAGVVLLLVGLLYILVYRMGFSRFFKVAWALFFLIILSSILFMEFVLPRLKLDYGQIIFSIISLPWFIWFLAGIVFLGAYFGLMTLAVRAKRAGQG